MNRLRLAAWFLIAWPLPALLAGALGWKGVWGSGSALADYLIPIPVAGGVLHLPSFVLGAIAVQLMPTLGPAAAGRLRALLFGAALAGVLWLLELGKLLLALQTGSSHVGSLWQQNPLGLFLVCDATLALLFTATAPQRPWLRPELLSLLLVLAPGTLPLSMAWPRSAAAEPFRPGMSRDGEQRGDETRMVFTRLPVDAPDFRARAEAWVAPYHPRLSVNSEDVAVLFTRDLEAATRFDTSKAAATLCLYEDGTPPRWLGGAGDCFGSHLSFSDRLAQALEQRPKEEPMELRLRRARQTACEGVAPADTPTAGVELASARLCGASRREPGG